MRVSLGPMTPTEVILHKTENCIPYPNTYGLATFRKYLGTDYKIEMFDLSFEIPDDPFELYLEGPDGSSLLFYQLLYSGESYDTDRRKRVFSFKVFHNSKGHFGMHYPNGEYF